jgi:threonyl-tRNA synthetase
MKFIIKRGQDFTSEDLPVAEAFARIDEMGEPYKREYAGELVEKGNLESLRFFTNGPFVDMCEGPHVANTRELPAGGFKIKGLAGAYWRGDERNVQMTRIYCYAFKTADDLVKHEKQVKEALARDHKKLGRDLDFFQIDEVIGKGLPLWLPNGTVLRDELEKLAKELEWKHGYQRVATPHLTREELYFQTGHLPYYSEGLYPAMELKEQGEGDEEIVRERYRLKPMNCPHHHRIFAARMRSYRDLPLRLAEYGQCYRYEDSGSLSGLLRVRGMCMNDAHIYCTEEQAKSEFIKVMELHKEVYDILGLNDYYMRLSTWDPEDPKGKEKYVDDPEGWERSQQIVREAMDEVGMPYVERPGEAAFYGPKIDLQLRTVTGREETASTNQLDFAIAARLNLVYTGADGGEHHPYVVHRAPLGTHERFIAFLIEHYGGAFPTWLSPIQCRFITVHERFDELAQSRVDALRNLFIRAELDTANDTMGKKIRNATTTKIPNILVIGEREMEDNTVTLRRYGSRAQYTVPWDDFLSALQTAIRTRSDAHLAALKPEDA